MTMAIAFLTTCLTGFYPKNGSPRVKFFDRKQNYSNTMSFTPAILHQQGPIIWSRLHFYRHNR